MPIFGDNLPNLLDGTDGSESIFGLDGNDTLNGFGGDDILDGGSGADLLTGGFGNDIYIVNDTGDRIVEVKLQGFDIVRTTVSFNAAAAPGIEDVDGSGATSDVFLVGNGGDVKGGSGNDTIDGSRGFLNLLSGGGGNDTITGSTSVNGINGGEGADFMAGGSGSDIYIVDDAGDVVEELPAGGGHDLIQTTISLTLPGNVEEGELLNKLDGRTLTGNGVINFLRGSDGNDILDGALGNDVLTGKGGNDILRIDGGDLVDGGAGSDTIETLIDSFLGDFTLVENLTAIGSANITLTGDAGNNWLTGNVGINVLNGGDGNDTLNGGAGADIMVGGPGNDVYFVDDTSDTVVETNEGAGSDTAVTASAVNLLLPSIDSIENVIAVGMENVAVIGDAGNNVLVGNAGRNLIKGGKGNDQLWGKGGDDKLFGGTGRDQLIGGDGKDFFEFDYSSRDKKADIIRDFTSKIDTIVINNSGFFSKIGSNGKFKTSAFVLGTVAKDAGDQIIYDRKSGALRFDADGVGGVAAIKFAIVADHAKLTAGDILII